MKTSRITLLILLVLFAFGELPAQTAAPAEMTEKDHYRHGHRHREKHDHKKRTGLFHNNKHLRHDDHGRPHDGHRHHGKSDQRSTARPDSK